MKLSIYELQLFAQWARDGYPDGGDIVEPDSEDEFLAEEEDADPFSDAGFEQRQGSTAPDMFTMAEAAIPGYLDYRTRCWDNNLAAVSPQEYITNELNAFMNRLAGVPTDGRKNPEYVEYLDDCAYRMVQPHAYFVWLDKKKRESTIVEDLQTELNEAREIANARLEELRQCQMERDECNNATGTLQTEPKDTKTALNAAHQNWVNATKERDAALSGLQTASEVGKQMTVLKGVAEKELSKLQALVKGYLISHEHLPPGEMKVTGQARHLAERFNLVFDDVVDSDYMLIRLEKS